MNVLLLTCYPDITFNKMIKAGIKIHPAAQKFNKLLAKGFCLNNCNVEVAVVYKDFNFNVEQITQESYASKTILYHFCKISGNFMQKELQKRKFAKKTVANFARKNPDGTLIIDSLSPLALLFSKYAKRYKLKIVTHITDFRDFLLPISTSLLAKAKGKLMLNLYYKQFRFTDYFVLLTDYMKNKIKLKGRKYTVIDGICDSEVSGNETISIVDEKNTIFMYTGALSKKFGIHNLIKGFLSANIENSELHLYGYGNYAEEIKRICSVYPSVKYFGTLPNEEIVKLQGASTFLVNPRPVGDEYTKYSFPSKTIEYMMAARPVITTKLPCITTDYDPYLYYFENDTAEGIKNTLLKYSQKSPDELNKTGIKAKEYVLREKNNALQAAKILELLK